MSRRPRLFDMELDFDGSDHTTPLTVVGLLSYSIYQVSLGFDTSLEDLILSLEDNNIDVRW